MRPIPASRGCSSRPNSSSKAVHRRQPRQARVLQEAGFFVVHAAQGVDRPARGGQFQGSRVVAVQARHQGVWSIGLVTGTGYGPLNSEQSAGLKIALEQQGRLYRRVQLIPLMNVWKNWEDPA